MTPARVWHRGTYMCTHPHTGFTGARMCVCAHLCVIGGPRAQALHTHMQVHVHISRHLRHLHVHLIHTYNSPSDTGPHMDTDTCARVHKSTYVCNPGAHSVCMHAYNVHSRVPDTGADCTAQSPESLDRSQQRHFSSVRARWHLRVCVPLSSGNHRRALTSACTSAGHARCTAGAY